MNAAGTSQTRVFVAGHRGMVGSALVRKLSAAGHVDLLLRRRDQLDLTRQSDVEHFFAEQKIDQVYLAAATVGGILANDQYPADFIRDNLQIQVNVLEAARQAGVDRLLLLGSSCIYPRNAPQPMTEESLLTGVLELTNEPYAVAKIAGIKMCESYRRQYGCDFRSIMPTNLYGPNDNFDLETSHVLPALLRRFHDATADNASEVVVWGSGKPRREFLHVDDMADACLVLIGMNQQEFWDEVPVRNSQVNVGTGEDIAIADLAAMIARIVGFQGEIRFDPSKPDGTPRKLLDVSRIHSMGWKARIGLHEGIEQTYQWMLDSMDDVTVNQEKPET